MSQQAVYSAKRPDPDQVLVDIAEFVLSYDVTRSQEALETARYCLMDTLGCGLLALNYPACTKLLGPVVPGATMAGGARVPGTSWELDPVQGAFNIGALIRWLDFNDTWLAAEWGHPSDNLGGILAVADYLSRQARAEGRDPLTGAAIWGTRRARRHTKTGSIITALSAVDNALWDLRSGEAVRGRSPDTPRPPRAGRRAGRRSIFRWRHELRLPAP